MAHKIYPHGLPETLSDGVWRVRGSLSFPINRNMIVLRLPGGGLLIHSAVAMDDAGLKLLETLGQPVYAIVPHAAHQMDAPFYAARYPALKILAPAVHREAVAANAPVAGTVEDALPALGFRLHEVPGTKVLEYVYEWPLPSGGRMLIANDVLGSTDIADTSKLLGRLVISRLATKGNTLGLSGFYKMMIAKDVAALKRFLGQLAAIPDLRLITVSHGEPFDGDVSAALRAASA